MNDVDEKFIERTNFCNKSITIKNIMVTTYRYETWTARLSITFSLRKILKLRSYIFCFVPFIRDTNSSLFIRFD